MRYKVISPRSMFIDCRSNLQEALKKINKNGYGLVFVKNQKKVIGVISDGDIRRVILRERKIDLIKTDIKEIMKKNFFYLKDYDFTSAKIKKYYKILPILNKKKEAKGFIKNNLDFIPIYQPLLGGNEKKYINNAIDANWISSGGKYVELFEKKFQSYSGLRNVTTTTSGTSALHLACLAVGVKPGDEVILPAYTFGAPINVVIQLKAKPVFVDVDYNTCCIDEKLIEKNITKKTKAIIIVHLYGNTCRIEKIVQLAKKYKIKLIEDCAEALGTTYKKKHVGGFGDASTFSFYGNKTISTGEGGIVSLKNQYDFKKAILYKNHGMEKNKNYFHTLPGLNFRMTNIQAAIGCAQIEKIKKIITKKKYISDFYAKFFHNSKNFKIVEDRKDTLNTHWLYFLVVKSKINKEKLLLFLKKKGIDVRRAFYSATEMPIYSKYLNKNKYPVSDHLSKKGFCLPSYPALDYNQLNRIVNLVQFFEKKNRDDK
jgi:perosamine synthetase